jgi:hypothetical protein
LQAVQEVNGLAGVRCGRENGPLVVFQDLQPFVDVAGVILSDFRRDAQIGTEKRGAKLGDQFLHRVAFVAPSLASQGKSVQDVFLGQSSLSFPASSREQWYVSVSRGKERLVVYTDDKQALQEVVAESDDRLSATELVNGKSRLAVDLNRRERDSRKRPPKEREEISHVR